MLLVLLLFLNLSIRSEFLGEKISPIFYPFKTRLKNSYFIARLEILTINVKITFKSIVKISIFPVE